MNTGILYLPCTKLCTDILAPWNIKDGLSVIRVSKPYLQDCRSTLIAKIHHDKNLGDLKGRVTAGRALCVVVIRECERDNIWFPGRQGESITFSFVIWDGKRMRRCLYDAALENLELGHCTLIHPRGFGIWPVRVCRQLGNDSDNEALRHQISFHEIAQEVPTWFEICPRRSQEKLTGYSWPEQAILTYPSCHLQKPLLECRGC